MMALEANASRSPLNAAMHHMMAKASTIWSKETGLDRNPADQVEVRRPDDARDRYLSEDVLRRLKRALDEKEYRRGTKDLNKTNLRLRSIVHIAVTTGMRASEAFGLRWSDVMCDEGLLAVRATLKGHKENIAQGCSRIVPPAKTSTLWLPLSALECGGQRRD
jgi:integrase